MKSYLVDTSTIINYLRGEPKTVERINSLEGELTSSFICLAELYEGVFRVKNFEKAQAGVLQFFKGLSQAHGLDEEISRNFGRLRATLKKKGTIIEDLDILVAATCLSNNLVLITHNPKHFTRVEELETIGLPVQK